MLGRYNGGAAYDRGIFLNLFNAPLIFNRDLKCEKTRLENPTFNMVMCGHPDEFGELYAKRNPKTQMVYLYEFFITCRDHCLMFHFGQ